MSPLSMSRLSTGSLTASLIVTAAVMMVGFVIMAGLVIVAAGSIPVCDTCESI